MTGELKALFSERLVLMYQRLTKALETMGASVGRAAPKEVIRWLRQVCELRLLRAGIHLAEQWALEAGLDQEEGQ